MTDEKIFYEALFIADVMVSPEDAADLGEAADIAAKATGWPPHRKNRPGPMHCEGTINGITVDADIMEARLLDGKRRPVWADWHPNQWHLVYIVAVRRWSWEGEVAITMEAACNWPGNWRPLHPAVPVSRTDGYRAALARTDCIFFKEVNLE